MLEISLSGLTILKSLQLGSSVALHKEVCLWEQRIVCSNPPNTLVSLCIATVLPEVYLVYTSLPFGPDLPGCLHVSLGFEVGGDMCTKCTT